MNIERIIETGNLWEAYGKRRVYFNSEFIENALALNYSQYKTGNISSAMLRGEKISNGNARKMVARINFTKVWFDLDTDKPVMNGELTDEEWEIVKQAIENI